MTLQSKKVLKGLKILTDNTECEFSYLYNSTCFCLITDLDKTYDYKKYENEIGSIITLLIQDGYIVKTSDCFTFQLTQKAIHSKSFAFHQIGKFLLSNVFVPVVVSIITTLLTLLITKLLSGQ